MVRASTAVYDYYSDTQNYKNDLLLLSIYKNVRAQQTSDGESVNSCLSSWSLVREDLVASLFSWYPI